MVLVSAPTTLHERSADVYQLDTTTGKKWLGLGYGRTGRRRPLARRSQGTSARRDHRGAQQQGARLLARVRGRALAGRRESPSQPARLRPGHLIPSNSCARRRPARGRTAARSRCTATIPPPRRFASCWPRIPRSLLDDGIVYDRRRRAHRRHALSRRASGGPPGSTRSGHRLAAASTARFLGASMPVGRGAGPNVFVFAFCNSSCRTRLAFSTPRSARSSVSSRRAPTSRPEAPMLPFAQLCMQYQARDGLLSPGVAHPARPIGRRRSSALVRLRTRRGPVGFVGAGLHLERWRLPFLRHLGYAVLEPAFRGTTGLQEMGSLPLELQAVGARRATSRPEQRRGLARQAGRGRPSQGVHHGRGRTAATPS